MDKTEGFPSETKNKLNFGNFILMKKKYKKIILIYIYKFSQTDAP